MEQTESALSVRELADSRQEGPALGPHRSAQKFEIGRPNPNATLEVAKRKGLGGGTCRNNLGFVQVDLEPNPVELP